MTTNKSKLPLSDVELDQLTQHAGSRYTNPNIHFLIDQAREAIELERRLALAEKLLKDMAYALEQTYITQCADEVLEAYKVYTHQGKREEEA